MIPVFAIFHYHRFDYLLRCIRSIDFPVYRLVIASGTPKFSDTEWENLYSLVVPEVIQNYALIWIPQGGLAHAFNTVIKTFPAPYWFFSSNDIQFRPGEIAKLVEAAQSPQGVAAFYGNLVDAYQLVTREAIEKVGLWDENFYPLYLECFDWMYRAQLAGLSLKVVQGCDSLHGEKGECGNTIEADPALKAKIQKRNWDIMIRYYRTKWGGTYHQEKFTHPFNNESLPIDYWRYDPASREQLI